MRRGINITGKMWTKSALLLLMLCATFLKTDCANLCDFCDVFKQCVRFPACKHYWDICKCEAIPPDIQCGVAESPPIPRISTYIVGGKDVGDCELPWTVALFIKGSLRCGGAIFDDRHIISAAHCLMGLTNPKDVVVGLGSKDRRRTRNATVSAFSRHPQHHSDVNDIAILRLEEPIKFDKCIRPICLPPQDHQYKANQTCIVAGWGLTSETRLFQPFKLQKVKVPLVDLETCQTAYNVLDTQLCAGYFVKGGKDSCNTDSGGPLICDYNDRWTLIGVVSSGVGCARPMLPGKYTRVSKYISWINYVTSVRKPYHY
ncbi:tryptase-2-like isoform X1 [Haliotis rubra]|uniref:tryptase-2-like isoform X1 n=1 Tax=Haliotis rubra TaxID=36100 RepID=UPI001EE5D30F|nr:tryptase-2-like isoform X1 [Haliotis rubra]